jgi:hypothetical protein
LANPDYLQTSSYAHPKASSATSIFAPEVPAKAFEPGVPPGPTPRVPSEIKYWLPLADLSELSSHLETGWFNVRGMNGETVFHVEITVQQAGRVLEISKVFAVGHSEMLAAVRPAASSAPARPSGMGGSMLPPQVLEVCLQDRRPLAHIESWGGMGGYSIMKGGQRAYSIVGNAATKQLSIIHAGSGHASANIDRRGVNFEGTDYLELVLHASVYDDRVFMLACVLGVLTLRSWPTQSEVPPQAKGEAQYPHLISVAGVSSASLQSTAMLR